jgi:drug/metabolite transporter (DMT)-like permease
MTTAPPRPLAVRAAFPAMLTGSIALAFGPWLVRSADVPAVASAFWRMALAIVPLALLAVAVGRRLAAPVDDDAAVAQHEAQVAWGWLRPLPRGGALAAIAAAGVLFALDLALWHLGIGRTTLANATLVGNCASFLLPIYGFVVTRTRPGRAASLAMLSAAAGMGLLIGRSADVSASHLTGDLLCIGAGVAYAAYFIAIDRVRSVVAPMPLLALATAFGAAALLPVAVLTGPIWPHDWTPLILLALGSQVIGQGLIVFAVGYLPPMVVGLTLLVQPAISATIGALRYGEAVGPAELGGMALVATALVLVRLPKRVAA